MLKRLWLTVPVSLLVLLGTVALASSSTRSRRAPTGPYQVYTIKYSCGEFGKTAGKDVPEGPYAPGFYQTAINVHYTALPPQIDTQNQTSITFFKKAVLDYAAGSTNAPVVEQTFEQPTPYSAPITATLPPDAGMLIDCQDIRGVLLKGITGLTIPPAPTFIEGDVVLMVPPSSTGAQLAPLNVNVVHTANSFTCTPSTTTTACTSTNPPRTGISEDVETVTPVTVNNP